MEDRVWAWGHVLAVDLTGDPLGPRGLALAPLGGFAMAKPRVPRAKNWDWSGRDVRGRRFVNKCQRKTNCRSVRQIGGQLARSPRRGAREGIGDETRTEISVALTLE